LVEKPEGKRPLGRPRCRWVDNIRMDLGEVGWGDVDWIGLAQDRNRWRALVNSVLNLRVPWNAGKLSSGLTSDGFSSSAQLHRVSHSVSQSVHLTILLCCMQLVDKYNKQYFMWHCETFFVKFIMLYTHIYIYIYKIEYDVCSEL
jgi:hypothetical protein